MSAAGGALRALLGIVLAWAWWTGRLSRLTDGAAALLSGAPGPAAAPASSAGAPAPSPHQSA